MFEGPQNRRLRRNSRRISQNIDRSTLGSHAGGSIRGAHVRNADDIRFSSRRKSSRAAQGVIHGVTPTTHTRENSRSHMRRVGQPTYHTKLVRRSRLRHVGVVAGIVLAVLLVAGGVSVLTYANSVSSNMSLNNSEAQAQLVTPTEGEPLYILCAGIFEAPGQPDRADALSVIRFDEVQKQISLLSLPPQLQGDWGSAHAKTLAATYEVGGDALLIQAVSAVMSVPISHYIKIDSEGFKKLIDDLGGLNVNLPEEVDDPNAGSIYLEPGEQTLNGEEALVYARACNYANSTIQRQENQLELMRVLAQRIFSTDTAGLPGIMDTLSTTIKTDLSATTITGLIEQLRSIDLTQIQCIQLPGWVSNLTDDPTFTRGASWSDALNVFRDSGETFVQARPDTSTVVPEDYSVLVRNGGGVTGVAARCSDLLGQLGFQMDEPGNTDSAVYDETLVIYRDESQEAAAQLIVDTLGVGRTTDASAYYSFDTDILVVVGRDYMA